MDGGASGATTSMAKAKRRPRTAPARSPRASTAPRRPRFVGREASPVLDRYPPKAPGTAPQGPPTKVQAPPASVTTPPASPAPLPAAPPGGPGQPLITLDRPFDVDEFATLLGETSIRVVVPRDALPEVLRRVTEFMGFGIYVYSLSVRPAPAELLKSFVVELQRVDYSAEKGAWLPFVEKGTTDSPFGPSGDRT